MSAMSELSHALECAGVNAPESLDTTAPGFGAAVIVHALDWQAPGTYLGPAPGWELSGGGTMPRVLLDPGHWYGPVVVPAVYVPSRQCVVTAPGQVTYPDGAPFLPGSRVPGDTWPAVDRDGWPLGVHGPGMSAAPCARECGHPLGEHGPHGCEHFAAGHDNGRRVTLHGCSCPVSWHGGAS